MAKTFSKRDAVMMLIKEVLILFVPVGVFWIRNFLSSTSVMTCGGHDFDPSTMPIGAHNRVYLCRPASVVARIKFEEGVLGGIGWDEG